ncbi:MAG: hypothetical protein LUQ38_12720 [Methanotrichaceae archaeon]|nr:hypothetical protein [Methanotrichaceae archaeon]
MMIIGLRIDLDIPADLEDYWKDVSDLEMKYRETETLTKEEWKIYDNCMNIIEGYLIGHPERIKCSRIHV